MSLALSPNDRTTTGAIREDVLYDDELTDEPLLPGFRLALRDLFAGVSDVASSR